MSPFLFGSMERIMESIITQNTDNLTSFKNDVSVTVNKGTNEQEDLINKTDQLNQGVEENIQLEKGNSKQQTQEELTKAINIVSDFMNQPPRNVSFSQAESSGKTIVKIFDSNSNELIKQFPSEKIINMAERISKLHQEIEQAPGLLIDSHV
jgi:flagellar protein FlaG